MAGKTITRADLCEAVYQKVGLSRTESASLVELVLKEITDCLERGETVKLSSFGSFVVRKKGQRVGRNPKTGKEVPISPRRVMVFKPSAILKHRINADKRREEVVSAHCQGRCATVEKSPDAFRTISEVAEELNVPQHVLRFWESRFREIKPLKRGGGRRYYRPEDIGLLRGIHHLSLRGGLHHPRRPAHPTRPGCALCPNRLAAGRAAARSSAERGSCRRSHRPSRSGERRKQCASPGSFSHAPGCGRCVRSERACCAIAGGADPRRYAGPGRAGAAFGAGRFATADVRAAEPQRMPQAARCRARRALIIPA